MNVVGRRARALDWESRTAGEISYAGDLDLPGLLVGKIKWSTEAHARIRRIRTGAARRLPGVAAVVTAADLPAGARYIHQGGDLADRPVLAADVVRFAGEAVAAVAAETEEQAEAALAAIEVSYRRRRAPFTLDEALDPGAETLHERPPGGNVAVRLEGSAGDLAAGRAASTRWVEGTWVYPRVSHVPLEPNVTVASWDRAAAKLELWTSTQAPYFIVKEVANALGLDQGQVVCHEVAVGGSFGSKSKISEHEVLAAALSMAAGRPVRIAFTREEEFATTKPRHKFRMGLRSGFDEDGRIHVFDADIDVDNGAYNHYGPSILGVGVKLVGSMYRPDAIAWRGRLVDTALPPGGQFRGYGSPQAALAMECQLDEIAGALEMDPIELRMRNANQPGTTALSGSRIGTARLTECLAAVREASGWEEHRAAPRPGRGLGVAASIHGSGAFAYPGSNRAEARIDVRDDGTVQVRYGGADAGTGQNTILAQIAAEELGLPLERVSVLSMDSEETPFDMGAWSSRGTHITGHAVRTVGMAAAEVLVDLAREKLGTDDVRLEDGMARSAADAVAIGDLVALAPGARDGVLSCEGEYVDERMEMFTGGKPANTSASYTFAAHVAEVEVDRDTGAVRVLGYWAAHDLGTAINPLQAEGQIVGGVVMGLGAALGEEMIYEQGRTVNPAFLNYPVPRAADSPPVHPILIEGGEPAGPYGAKSVGELPVTPVASAVANAIYDAVGIRLREPPFTPDKVLAALRPGRPPTRPVLLRPDRWWVSFIRWLYPKGLFWFLHRIGSRFARRVRRRPVAEVVAPADAAGAVAAHGDDAAYLGGGTDLLLQRRQDLAAPVRLVSVAGVAGMQHCGPAEDGSYSIGGAVTLARLIAEAGPDLPLLAEAAATIASPQIRTAATIAGNLVQAKRCWFFRNGFECYKRSGPTCPCYAVLGDHRFHHAALGAHRCQAVTPSDLATVLTALDASVEFAAADGTGRVPIADFYTGPGETILRPGDLITAVVVPAAAAVRRGAFEKLRLWEGDFAVASAAVAADVAPDGRWRDVRIVLGAVAPEPWRALGAERALDGTRVGAAAAVAAVERDLWRAGHPLAGNRWKLGAAAGLVGHAVRRMTGEAP